MITDDTHLDSEMSIHVNLDDLKWYADRYRGKHKTSGPHWSAINRIPLMFDELVRINCAMESWRNELNYWQTRAGNDEIIIREAVKLINDGLPGMAENILSLHMEDDNK